MRIRTQNLPNSFSSDNKKQKVIFARNCASGKGYGDRNLTGIAGLWLPTIMPLPDSLPWMESVDAKMVRAKEHLDTLHAEAGVFFESTKRNFILKSNGQKAWIVHYIEDSIPPIRLGVLLGESVFNIRSALDNLVCGLIRTADSHAPCKGTQFPICSAQEQWEKNWQKYLNGVEPAAQKMIRDLQPCFRMSAVPENDPLSILNVLCNSDKHRAVTLTLAYSHDLTVRVHANDGKVHVWRATEPIYAGDVHTIPLNLDPASIQPSARVETSGTDILIIREIGPWGQRPVWSVLTDLYEYVRDRVVIPLKPFFVASHFSSP